jgi:hypothetical protein
LLALAQVVLRSRVSVKDMAWTNSADASRVFKITVKQWFGIGMNN